jgi:hypothetical protein
MSQIMTSYEWLTFVGTHIVLQILFVLGGISSQADGWFSPLSAEQKERYAPEVTHFFTCSEHWGWWALFVLNVFLALAVMLAWRQWNLPVFAIVLIVMLIASIYMMHGWAMGDNDPTKRVLSAFSRNGLLTVPGVLLAVSGGFAYTIAIMFFFTPRTEGQDGFALAFAIALTVYLFIALLQPPKHVWGEIHAMARWQTLGGICVVWALFFLRMAI